MPTKPLPVTSNNIAFKVLTDLMVKMFEPEERRLQAMLDRLIEQNQEVMPASTGAMCGFIFNGERHIHSRYPGYPGTLLPGLSFGLNDPMDAWLKDKAVINQDRDLIQQTLFKCVFNWRDGQDFRNRMPDAVVPLLSDGLQLLPRTVPFEEATCLKDRDRRQFEKILPKIELYTAVRLIY
jgi:hypothetical protein